jgi:hypothetical protein
MSLLTSRDFFALTIHLMILVSSLWDPVELKILQTTKEFQNGRLAMLAAAGFLPARVGYWQGHLRELHQHLNARSTSRIRMLMHQIW